MLSAVPSPMQTKSNMPFLEIMEEEENTNQHSVDGDREFQ